MIISDILNKTAAVYPDNTAVIYLDESISYKQLNSKVSQLADFLKKQSYPDNARIGVFFENSIDYVIAYFAVIRAGYVVVPLDTSLHEDKLNKILHDSSISTLCAGFKFQRLFKKLYSLNHPLKVIIAEKEFKLQDDLIKYFSFENILTNEIVEPATDKILLNWDDAKRAPHELAAIFYTSGSTGEAKGVMLSHKNLISNTIGTNEYLKLTDKDSVMVILPFYYIYGNSLLLTHISTGGTLVIDNRFMYAETILDTMQEEKVTGLSGVPSNFMILLNKSTLTDRDFPNLRYFTQAGGAMAPEIIKKLHNAFPEKEIYIMYGQTEASPRVTWLPPEKLMEKLGSIGIEVNGVDVKILKEDGSEASTDETGEIVVGGDSIMLGYWNQPEEQSSVLKEGWLYTGDLARRDKDGYIYIVGRKKEIIKSGGNRISVKEVEETLLTNQKIHEVAVFGVEDDIFGEAVKAVIVLKENENADDKEIQRYIRSILPEFKVPKYIDFVAHLPKTQAGKIDKKQLK